MDSTDANPHKSSGLKRIWNAAFYSFEGMKISFLEEAAFRQEVLLACVLIPIALFLPVSFTGKSLMIASIFLVLIVELLNSAIEAVVDRVSLEKHPLSKRAKDMGSAAVFLGLMNVLVVWGGVLLDHFLK